MAECNSHSIYPNLSVNPSYEQQFSLNKINKIKDYFIVEIKERELMSKKLVSILLLLTILIRH